MTALELRDIDKHFGAVHANAGASLVVDAGSVHALVGENGAGKSTLMKIAYGLVRADAGSVSIKGEEVGRASHSPAGAIARGVGMVHQHFMLVGTLSVAENIVLGREPRRGPLLDLARAEAEIAELSAKFGFDVDPRAIVEDLSVGEQQRVEILKVLWRGADVLILDEPTAVLTPGEVRDLFGVLRDLVRDGVTIVMITHKLDEVLDIADRVTVMRRGAVVDELDGEGLQAGDIARAMVGRPVAVEVERAGRGRKADAEPVVAIEGLVVHGRGGTTAVRELSLDIHAGEIVGIAGVQGNGQSELVEALAGLRPVAGGSVVIGGVNLTGATVRRRARSGVAHVPEDRHARGLVLDYSVEDNLILGQQRSFASALGLDRARIRARADRLIERYEIRPGDPTAAARGLSGGNQQKVVVARELDRPHSASSGQAKPRLLLCAQPTRGVDIGAIEQIHASIVAARDDGVAVLLVSAELSELRALSDRIVVMYGGRVVGDFDSDDLDAEDLFDRLGALMTGAAA